MKFYQIVILSILAIILMMVCSGLFLMLKSNQNLNPNSSIALPAQQFTPITLPKTTATPITLPKTTATPTVQLMPTLSLTGNYNNLNTLTQNVVGRRLKDLSIAPYEEKGVNGYDIELVVSTVTKTRLETLQMAYVLLHEIYYNFPSNDRQFIMLSIRPLQDKDCVIGVGLGVLAVYEFLPQTPPNNFERWFQKLVSSQYYADLPGQTDLRLAYANDHTSFSRCSLSSLK